MKNTFTAVAAFLAVGICTLGTAGAQQAPASASQPAASSQQTPSTKPKTSTTAAQHPAAAAKTAPPATLTTEKEKVSYAIGMNIGENLHKQAADLDAALVQRGMKDVLAGGKTLLTEDEVKSVLTAYQGEMRKKLEEEMKQAAETNKKAGEEFLAANKTKEGVVALPSGLQYKILTEGTGPKPAADDTVVCNYRGTLINGTEFDSSYKRGQPATFPVGQVIKGWTEALQLMPVGSKWQLFVPSDLAYGVRSPGPGIGPNDTLIFEVELLSIAPKTK